jgi:steroid delta-isomerase-like uncharacterized protein
VSTTTAQPILDQQFIDDWLPRYTEAWNRHDGPAVAAMCSEDITIKDPVMPEGAVGRQAVAEFVEETTQTFPDFFIENLGEPCFAASEPMVTIGYEISGTMLGGDKATGFGGTGRKLRVAGVDRYWFDGEMLCRVETYYDSLDVARQLGILPARGSIADRLLARMQRGQAWFMRRSSR